MNCPKCGNTVRGKFCGVCGTPVQQTDSDKNNIQSNESKPSEHTAGATTNILQERIKAMQAGKFAENAEQSIPVNKASDDNSDVQLENTEKSVENSEQIQQAYSQPVHKEPVISQPDFRVIQHEKNKESNSIKIAIIAVICFIVIISIAFGAYVFASRRNSGLNDEKESTSVSQQSEDDDKKIKDKEEKSEDEKNGKKDKDSKDDEENSDENKLKKKKDNRNI